ncbi:MAG: RsmD family RNA methyltransferase [Pirellulales bacterium]|nr:RsmD family RNA methyltransferase [Pirellulales bacterium]
MARRGKPTARSVRPTPSDPVAAPLRIVGGNLRGRKLLYSGDPRTRPMKDRVREAVFNLVGPSVVGAQVFDLFAGTGAMGLEAVSRGAAQATLVERHFPTAKLIEQTVADLGIEAQAQVAAGDVFHWVRHLPEPATGQRWAVFICPPYRLFQEQRDEMLQLVDRVIAAAPLDSIVLVEADANFDFATLPDADRWNVRAYLPAVIGTWRPQSVTNN